MKFLKSLLTGTGGVVLAGLVLALLAPKAVHAVVATAVQVVNTSASPAIMEDTSRQASQIVTLSCLLHASACFTIGTNGGGSGLGPHGGYVVPANEYFVLKSMDTAYAGTAIQIAIAFYYGSGPNDNAVVEFVTLPPKGQITFSSGIVAGPGIEVAAVPSVEVQGFATLHGYLTSN